MKISCPSGRFERDVFETPSSEFSILGLIEVLMPTIRRPFNWYP